MKLALLTCIWIVPGGVIALIEPGNLETLAVNSPIAISLIVVIGYFLKHISKMNHSRDDIQKAVLDTVKENTEALTRLEGAIRDLKN